MPSHEKAKANAASMLAKTARHPQRASLRRHVRARLLHSLRERTVQARRPTTGPGRTGLPGTAPARTGREKRGRGPRLPAQHPRVAAATPRLARPGGMAGGAKRETEAGSWLAGQEPIFRTLRDAHSPCVTMTPATNATTPNAIASAVFGARRASVTSSDTASAPAAITTPSSA